MKYVLQFLDRMYYCENVKWYGVDKIEDATKMTHKEACKIRNYLGQPSINVKSNLIDCDLAERQLTKEQTESLEKAENSEPVKVKTRELPSRHENNKE